MTETDTGTPAVRLKKNGRPAKPAGRHTSLTDETERQVLAAIRTHQRFSVAARLVPGVSQSSIYDWRQKGIEAKVFLDAGGRLSALTALQRRCLDFSESVSAAEAQAEGRAVRGWLAAGLERQVERTTRQRFAGMDDNGAPIMVTEVTEREFPPDAGLLVKWLQARVPAYRATAPPDVSVEITLRAASLAERVRAAAIPAESAEVEP